MNKRMMIILAMVGLITLLSVDFGCSSSDNTEKSEDSALHQALRKVPGGIRDVFAYSDVERMRENPGMNEVYASMDSAFNRYVGSKLGIFFADVERTYYTDGTQIHEGDFDLVNIERVLTESSLSYQDFEGIPMWETRIYGDRIWATMREGAVITGIQPINLAISIELMDNQSSNSLLTNPHVRSLIDRLPDDTMVKIEWGRFRVSYVYNGLAVSASATQADSEGMMLFTGVLKFDTAKTAQSTYELILQDMMNDTESKWTDVAAEIDAEYILVTARQTIEDFIATEL